jgi:hypothetical protein
LTPVIGLTLALAAAVAIVYQAAPGTYFYNDDFQWLLAADTFRWSSWLNPSAHGHFFRPLPELYFHLARGVWDRSAPAYHLANVLLHCVNALLVWRVATLLGGRRVYAVAALCFIVQPGAVEAVAWVCAVSTGLAAMFFLSAIWFHVRFVETRDLRWATCALAAFAGCLASHESSVMLLPVLYLAQCARGRGLRWPWDRDGHGPMLFVYLPYLLLLGLYLAVEYAVNIRNYVVSEGHYALGLHVIRNLVDYLIGLHLGQHTLAARIGVVTASVLLLALGSARIKFYTAWVWLTLLPGSLFTWGTVGRYEYLAAAGLSLLVGEAVVFLDDRLRTCLPRRVAATVAILVMALVVGRSAVFARKAVNTFQRTAEPYRAFVAEFQLAHPARPSGRVETTMAVPAGLSPVYLEAAIRLAYDNHGITLVFKPPAP